MNAPPPAPKRNTIKIVAAVIAGLALVLALNVGAGVLMTLLSKEKPLSLAEREALVDITTVTNGMEFEPDLTKESAKRIEYFDGSHELDYEYDDPRDEAPYLTHVVSYERKASDAVATYATQWGAAKLILAASGESFEIVEPANGFKWGEQSAFGIVQNEDTPVGNVFVARKGKMTIYFFLSGLYYDDADDFGELIEPFLTRAENLSATR